MNAAKLCAKFFEFFVAQGHTRVPSSPVIPAEDPTLLFTNAGMNQFKDLFLGREQRSYRRAVSIQKCIRAGGKHNDLDNVGFTSRHLTFFEMMGNFSFGDYFKERAIRLAWDFLTKELAIPAERLYVSVFEQDDEAYQIWHHQIEIPASRIVRLGARDNFWQMGDTGPCGPCSEIYIDRGRTVGCGREECAPGCSCDRFLEIWNLVFMQFDRQQDGTHLPLHQTGVDTGMGLDRLCAVLQNKDSVFETDLFAPILAQIEALSGIPYRDASPAIKGAFHVVADHIRSTAFAIADGAHPAPDGRGYVLRKIIRRAALFAHKLAPHHFFPQLIDGLITALGERYPELVVQRALILHTLTHEVEQFSRNLIRGKTLLEEKIAQLPPQSRLPGSVAFTLYDTYGFPLELTTVIAQEHGLSVDHAAFETEMERQRSLSHQHELEVRLPLDPELTTLFTGYESLETETTIAALYCGTTAVEFAPADTLCWIVPAASPVYVAGGGQVTDDATIMIQGTVTPVIAALKQGAARALCVQLPLPLQRGAPITIRVNREKRHATMKNHTATHLLQSALEQLFGSTIKQAGSLVCPDYLRFDVQLAQQPTPEQIQELEIIINRVIQDNIPLSVDITTLQEAQQWGAKAFFGEKYNPESVRVVSVPGTSIELCGGTHVPATGAIGFFKITDVSALAAGIRRFVAVTGNAAVTWVQQQTHLLRSTALSLKVSEAALPETVNTLRTRLKDTQQQVRTLRKELWKIKIPQWIATAQQVQGIRYALIIENDMGAEELRELATAMAQKSAGLWFIIATQPHHERITFCAAVSPALRAQLPLQQLLKQQLVPLGLRGGGSDTAIQGGASHLPENLEAVITTWIAAPHEDSTP